MAESRWYRVSDHLFLSPRPMLGWIRPGGCYEARAPSAVVPVAPPCVRLIHPTQPGVTALVRKALLTEVLEEECHPAQRVHGGTSVGRAQGRLMGRARGAEASARRHVDDG